MIQPKYTICFASIPVKCVIGEEKDKYLALASLENLRAFIPNIDPKNIDLLPLSFDAFVANHGNKNGDILDTNQSLAVYKTFINKPIDVEHNRTKVVGVILTASLSEYGTNKPLTEDDVKGKDDPFNVTLGGVLWRVINGELCDFIEDSNDPESPDYLKANASWELGFSDYDIIEMEQGKKNLNDGTIIKNPETIETLKKYLKCFGGSGVKNGKSYYRMPSESVIAMGIGLTEKPAADVKGIAVKVEENDKNNDKTPENMKATEVNNLNNDTKNISQNEKDNVKRGRRLIMKITSIADITDENLKECTASVVTDFIKDELKKASDKFMADKEQQATAGEKLQNTANQLNDKVEQMKASLEILTKEKENRDKLDKFNARMSEVIASYEMPEDVTKVIAEELRGISTEEAFAAWKNRADTLLKPFSKAEAAKKAEDKKKKDAEEAEAKEKKDKDGDKDGDKEAMAKKAKADEEEMAAKAKAEKEKKDKDGKEAVASAIDGAIDNSEVEKGGITNTGDVGKISMKEKYAQAFAEENFVIKSNK